MDKYPEIDFVVTWVDGGDKVWRKEKASYSPKTEADDREERYRDWELLQYWFRGVEKYAPWVRKIHFVTWGHLPKWLDTSNPKLHIVNHKDYIPKEYLPTFSSHPIELNFHRIDGLSENFVYFNDDMFPIGEIKPADFFVDGKPCDMLAFQPVVANPANPVMSHLYLNNTLVLSRHFNKRENVKRQPGKYFRLGYPLLYFLYNFLELAFPLFTGFYTVHGPFPFCKETFVEVWKKEEQVLADTCNHKFRSSEDVTPYLIREWKKLKGEFCPRNLHQIFQYFNVSNHNEKLITTIEKQKTKVVCINDANTEIDFEKAKKELCQAFEAILPEKCSFEK